MRSSIVITLALTCAALQGCASSSAGSGGEGQLSPDQAAALEDGLRAKPPLEAAQDQYRTAVQQMADHIAALVPAMTWQVVQDEPAGCGGDYVWTRGKHANFLVAFSGPLPDDSWPQAVQILKSAANQFGADDFAITKDEPGRRAVYVRSADGVEFKLTSLAASSLTAKSDCRLSRTDTLTTSGFGQA